MPVKPTVPTLVLFALPDPLLAFPNFCLMVQARPDPSPGPGEAPAQMASPPIVPSLFRCHLSLGFLVLTSSPAQDLGVSETAQGGECFWAWSYSS